MKKKSGKCILWPGEITHKGYGRFRCNGRWHSAHRAAYEQYYGVRIPKGMHIDHLCRNRSCINPLHLEVVTPKENLMRGDTIAARNAAKTHCKRGHPLSGDNLMVLRSGSRRCRVCHNADGRRHWRRNNP